MWSMLKTLVMVGVVTLLIWLWAEAESLSSQVVSPRLEIIGGPDLSARLGDDAWTGAVRVRVRGAKLAMERLQQLLAQPLRLTPGVGTVPAAAGEHALDLRAALREHPELARLGVTIDEVEPASARLILERVTTKVLPVRLDAKGLDLAGEPRVDPATVSLRLPEAAAERLPPDAVVTAVLDQQALAGLTPEVEHTLRARLVPPSLNGGSNPTSATVNPATAQVTLRTRGLSRSATFDNVPVRVILPPDQLGRWIVETLDAAIPSVFVTGRPQQVAALEDPRSDLRLAAYVVLTAEDLRAAITEKPAVFALTPTELRFAPERPVVRLKITPR
jgi:hypothetical protein